MVSKNARKYPNPNGILDAQDVDERNNRCREKNLCFISLRPLTDENSMTVFTTVRKADGRNETTAYCVLKQFGEAAIEVMNK